MKVERRRARVLTALLLLLVFASACRGASAEGFALDGSPRHADDEGVVTAVNASTITLDGERRYDLGDPVVSFSSIDLSALPLGFTKHQYVQVGLDGDTVTWIGAVARPLATDPPAVVYVGDVDRAEAGRLTFANGTVFRLDDSVDATSAVGHRAQISLDPEEGLVTEVQS